MSRLVDTAAAQLGRDVKPAIIRNWLHRGKLTCHGDDYCGKAIVDLNEIEQVLATKHAA
ncbi:hypothetical protein [Streptomyces sp. NPDC056707]|uniref:hypothetical protein n=1 Tax=Streptomyces sp. NPDC056707 TaxID=3345919 RepID=UPI0036BB5D43